MWWLVNLADRSSRHITSAVERPGWSCLTAHGVRLWHGQSGPAAGLRRVDVPGCTLLVIGCCTAPEKDLFVVANRVARGDVDALVSVGGSRVVIAVRPDDVVVVGDLAGQCVVFHARSLSGDVVISSQASELARLAGSSLDPDWLAARLLLPEASDVWWTGSPWQGVRAVRPGWALQVDRAGQIETRPWTVLPPPASGLPEAGARLFSALETGVSSRMAEAASPTADLSGGLDSSTLALLAVRARGEISAITLDVPGVDDVELAAELAGQVPGLVHERWAVPDAVLPYSDLDAWPVLDEPADMAVASAWLRWWMNRIAAHGSDLHLSGGGGDGVLLGQPTYLADLANPTSMGELWRHANGWAHLRNKSPWSLVRAAVKLRRTSYQEALRGVARHLADDGPDPSGWERLIRWLGHSALNDWVRPEARASVAQALLRHADNNQRPVVPGEFGLGDSTAWSALAGFSRSQRLYAELAASCGVNYQTPFLDDEVVRACWSVPAWVRTTPATPKPLLQHAVRGVVPDVLLDRRTKGDYTSLSYKGLRSNAAMLDDLFTRSRLGELGLIDDQALRRVVRQGAAGVPIRLGAFDVLVSTELWLRGQDKPSTTRTTDKGAERAGTR
ncbi:asparagine synthase (glutamine-hydrolysing) [Lentzea atacamensis]|uniref:asparagine synthase (glutamine-hydrolyzing) n=1 Tax=Lentzea atacamensis TaxID=531938 RepID=A0A316HRD2_9PSEU|nr:albusnodin/ikarugamycin family macrolactam cyclase [Lentzea atacamensis]PWK83217.1 asparagine synthase (glutamine-hydrolysing) [Lentzea atacamensis]